MKCERCLDGARAFYTKAGNLRKTCPACGQRHSVVLTRAEKRLMKFARCTANSLRDMADQIELEVRYYEAGRVTNLMEPDLGRCPSSLAYKITHTVTWGLANLNLDWLPGAVQRAVLQLVEKKSPEGLDNDRAGM